MTEVLMQKDGVCILQVVKHGCQNGYPCAYCRKAIPDYTFGLVTIVSEGFGWCYKCAVQRLKNEPELQEFLISLVRKEDSNGC